MRGASAASLKLQFATLFMEVQSLAKFRPPPKHANNN